LWPREVRNGQEWTLNRRPIGDHVFRTDGVHLVISRIRERVWGITGLAPPDLPVAGCPAHQ
jgi:hypothetical protein